MITLCILVLLASIFVWDYLTRDQRKIKLARNFKGPLALPILGNLWMYMNKKPEGKYHSLQSHISRLFISSVEMIM